MIYPGLQLFCFACLSWVCFVLRLLAPWGQFSTPNLPILVWLPSVNPVHNTKLVLSKPAWGVSTLGWSGLWDPQTHKRMYTRTHTHAHTCTRAHTCAHAHAHTHARTHTHSHAHAHMHTHTHAQWSSGNDLIFLISDQPTEKQTDGKERFLWQSSN